MLMLSKEMRKGGYNWALVGLAIVAPGFNRELKRLYTLAIKEDLWADTYAISNVQEYWAEGVQDYFDTNLEAAMANGVHNQINTRAELAEYDPRLYRFIDNIFAGFEWSPRCP